MNIETILRAYEIIGDKTPLNQDCGKLCKQACCEAEDDISGVALFPCEIELIMGEDWCHTIDTEDKTPLLVCDRPCKREKRPLGCRIFPLTPYYTKGVWSVRMDIRANSMCPLTRFGVKGLNKEFVMSVKRAVNIIAEDSEGVKFLRKWQAIEDEFRDFRL